MSQEPPIEIQIIGSSLNDIKEALELDADLRSGTEIPLLDGARLNVTDVSKSSGFDVTTVVLMAVITVATSTSSALLTEWLKSRLFKSGAKSGVSIIVNGKELEIRPGT
jgi:hypothetical protein